MASQTSLPAPLAELVEQLAKLPGLGPKSALKVAMTLLEWPRARAESLGDGILRLRERLCLCRHCAGLSETPVCPVCADPGRNHDQLCLTAQWDSIMQIEETGLFAGRYLVLGGLLDPLEGVSAGQLRLDMLRARLAEGEVRECILALGATLAAESTASHISRRAPDPAGPGHPARGRGQIRGQGNPVPIPALPPGPVGDGEFRHAHGNRTYGRDPDRHLF